MARFHFDIRSDGEPWSEDEDGVELSCPEEAGHKAVSLAFALGVERPPHKELVVRIRDGDAEPLAQVRVSVERHVRPD
jgi:hypothetical protein